MRRLPRAALRAMTAGRPFMRARLSRSGDAKRDQRLGVAGDGRLERDGRLAQACFQFKVSPPRSGLSKASPNGTLAGSSYAWRRSVTRPVLRGRP